MQLQTYGRGTANALRSTMSYIVHYSTHVKEVAELVILGCDEADSARSVLVLSTVLHVHLEERCEPLEEISKACFVG